MESSSARFIVLVILSMFLGGCALTDATVKLAYLPEPGKMSPLVKIAPLNISLQIDDQRPAEERSWIGNKRNGYGMVTAHVKSETQVVATIAEGIKNELASNGHKVLDSSSVDSSVQIRLELRKYWTDVSIHFWDLELSAILLADVQISRDKPLLSKPLQGSFRESRQVATDGAYQNALNGALREFIRGFARDPAVLKALEDAGKNLEINALSREPSRLDPS